MFLLTKQPLGFLIYSGILLLSVFAFYFFDGSFTSGTGFFAHPSFWYLWLLFLYVGLPLVLVSVLLFKVLVKRIKLEKSEIVGVCVFMLALSFSHFFYWLAANNYKMSLHQEITHTQLQIQNSLDAISTRHTQSLFEPNPYNKTRNYKVTFELTNPPLEDTEAHISGSVSQKNDKAISRIVLLSPATARQNYEFYIDEKSLRDQATSSDSLNLTIHYVSDFPQAQYDKRVGLAQVLCTWSVIACEITESESVFYNTQLFSSARMKLPFEIKSGIKPLINMELSDFSGLDSELPFTHVSFISESAGHGQNQGFIDDFYLEFNIDANYKGDLHSYISSIGFSRKLTTVMITHQGSVDVGKNTIRVPVNLEDLTRSFDGEQKKQPIKFSVFISNNRFWYCPNKVCEIVNEPHQLKYLELQTNNSYSIEDFSSE